MSMNVLIVDDSGVVRGMIAKTLDMGSIPVSELYEASNGEEGLSVLGEHWIDLVFVDLNMPVMTGNEMVARMKQDPVLKEMPIILLTSEGSTTRVEEIKALGVQAYLRKPCTPEAIHKVVEDVVGSRERPKTKEIAEKVFCDVLEHLAFMFGEPPSDDEETEPQGGLVRATTRFRGRMSGEVTLLVPEDLCGELACNVLGVDILGSKPEELSRDALGELLNVTCGHLLTALAGEGPAFEVTVPVVEPVEVTRWRELRADPDACVLQVDGRPILLRMKAQGSEA